LINNHVVHDGKESCQYTHQSQGTFGRMTGYLPDRINQENEHGLDRVSGNWKQVKGKIKEQWGKLTDDDLNVIDGRRDQLEGKIEERYGYAKDQVRKDIDDWYGSQRW
jgi:uncharacterized protein YjbJ (UPF0337 family)